MSKLRASARQLTHSGKVWWSGYVDFSKDQNSLLLWEDLGCPCLSSPFASIPYSITLCHNPIGEMFDLSTCG
jgi:hypothetical protein